jgi:hypothetical protein
MRCVSTENKSGDVGALKKSSEALAESVAAVSQIWFAQLRPAQPEGVLAAVLIFNLFVMTSNRAGAVGRAVARIQLSVALRRSLRSGLAFLILTRSRLMIGGRGSC